MQTIMIMFSKDVD